MGVVEPGLFDGHCARLSIPHGSPSAWCGWRQNVHVEPNKSYLYAAWLKCEDLKGGVQLHAHYRNVAGEYCEKAETTGAGPAIDSTTDWSLLSGLFTMPEDIANFQLHLTMNATGTAWHDGALLVEVTAGQVGRHQSRSAPSNRASGSGRSIRSSRFFRTTSRRRMLRPRISMARNEVEPLQLAIRSDRAILGVHVQVDGPQHGRGHARRHRDRGRGLRADRLPYQLLQHEDGRLGPQGSRISRGLRRLGRHLARPAAAPRHVRSERGHDPAGVGHSHNGCRRGLGRLHRRGSLKVRQRRDRPRPLHRAACGTSRYRGRAMSRPFTTCAWTAGGTSRARQPRKLAATF